MHRVPISPHLHQHLLFYFLFFLILAVLMGMKWGDWFLNLIWFCCLAAQSCPTLCSPMDSSMPGSHVLHHLPESAQTHVYWVSDAIQPPHPLSPPSPLALKTLAWYYRIRYTERHLTSILGWRTLHHVLSLPFSNNLQFFCFSSLFLSLSCIQSGSFLFYVCIVFYHVIMPQFIQLLPTVGHMELSNLLAI